MSTDLKYLAIFSLVLILPKLLMRLKVPSGITALALGVGIGFLEPTLSTDQLFRFLAQIGITSLFVFSGLEVDFGELKQNRTYLSKYLIKYLLILGAMSFGLKEYFDLSVANSIMLSLGIFTPSAGFIINSLHSFNMSGDLEYWVKSKAISKEVVSIFLLFFATQAGDMSSFLKSSAFFAILIFLLPYLFKLFFRFISPYAPNSEVPFLVSISLIAGVLSKELGAYYLVGAFIVGIVGAQFKKDIFKDDEEGIFKSLSSFFNVFLPFYFFAAGMKIKPDGMTLEALGMGVAMVVIFTPLRLISVGASIRYLLKDFVSRPYAVSVSLLPTLIFGLVIANLLEVKQGVPRDIVYALIIYTLITSLLPTFAFGVQKIRGKAPGSET